MSNESSQIFMNLVQKRHDQYKSCLSSLLDAISNNDQAKKIEENKALLSAAQNLSDILADQDRPAWLSKTIAATDAYSRKNATSQSVVSGSSAALLKELMRWHRNGMSHSWSFEGSNATVFDFDAVFERVQSTSSVEDLFDSLIASLEKMLATGEIDSVRAIEALKDLIRILSKNKNGSYFSIIVTWQFARSLVKNILWESLDELPLIKPIKAGFERTLKEAGVEVSRLSEEVSENLCQRFDFIPDKIGSKKNDILLLNSGESSDTDSEK